MGSRIAISCEDGGHIKSNQIKNQIKPDWADPRIITTIQHCPPPPSLDLFFLGRFWGGVWGVKLHFFILSFFLFLSFCAV